MSPADEESKGFRSCGPRRRELVPEAPPERRPPKGGLAPAFEHAGYRSVDDGIGESPASQFEGDLEAPGAAAKHQLLGPSLGQHGVVDVSACSGGRERRLDDLLREARGLEVARDLGARPRGACQVRDRGGERRRRRLVGGFGGVKSGRS
jgi:hypothetical protein